MVPEGSFGRRLYGNRLLAVGVAGCSTGIAVLSGNSDVWWPAGKLVLAAGLFLILAVVVRASWASNRRGDASVPATAQKHLALTLAGALPAVLGFLMVGTDGATLALSVMPLLFWGHHAHRNGLGRSPVVVPCIVAAALAAIAFLAPGAQPVGFTNTASGIIVGFGFSCAVALGLELLSRRGNVDEPSGQPRVSVANPARPR